MESIKDKRVVNGAAWIFLGLSMFATLIGVITNFLNYNTYTKMGIYQNSSIFIIEAILDILILVAGFFTFKKNRYGLIALTALFIIRMFATVPWGGDVSHAYMLGGKTVYLLRDFGLFAIAMCFCKNGISGWRAFFASDEWIEAHYMDKTAASEKLNSTPKGVTEFEPKQVSVLTATSSTDNEKVEEVIPEPPALEIEKPISSAPKKHQLKTINFKWWYVIIGIAAIIAVFFLYLLVKPYPDYLESFSEKWNYTFNKPNNGVANRLFDEAMTHHPKDGFLVVRGKDVTYKSELDVYRNLDSYKSSCKLYAFAGPTINSKDEVIDTCLYSNEVIANGVFKFSLLTGKDLIDYYEFIESNFKYVKNNLVKPHNIEFEYAAEKSIIEIVHDIPVTDNDLISDMYIYYAGYQNKTLLQEYFDKNYKYNRNNDDFLADYLDVLLYVDCLDEAKQVATRLIKKDAKNTDALSTLSYVSAEYGDWEKAESYAKKAVDYGTENIDAYFILAEALYKKGNKDEARRIYNQGSNKIGYSELETKYKEAGGCPFKINSIAFAFKTYDGDVITDYGQKLYSSKSQYVCPRINVTADRALGTDDIIQCKLYNNGRLERGGESPNGYTFEWANNHLASSGSTVDLDVSGWGASYSGVWPSGNYRLEVYYNDIKIGEESFHIY